MSWEKTNLYMITIHYKDGAIEQLSASARYTISDYDSWVECFGSKLGEKNENRRDD